LTDAEEIAGERIAGLEARLADVLAKYREALAMIDRLRAELALCRGGFARAAADSEPATFDPLI
jgi:hypothetical protein